MNDKISCTENNGKCFSSQRGASPNDKSNKNLLNSFECFYFKIRFLFEESGGGDVICVVLRLHSHGDK